MIKNIESASRKKGLLKRKEECMCFFSSKPQYSTFFFFFWHSWYPFITKCKFPTKPQKRSWQEKIYWDAHCIRSAPGGISSSSSSPMCAAPCALAWPLSSISSRWKSSTMESAGGCGCGRRGGSTCSRSSTSRISFASGNLTLN
ncbi:hypothetical protein I7I50_02682 [Histoplasma capsulatum G186AR]|uniref:Uncharacterized protein n=1 Tax=Ajellomyces capsulatus TaxID=5037 RepID=A0A8H7Z2Z4_AJECA|nr:hypothetical protein I7I52_00652 [Histoplasma capsulatum]QSS71728.1 hypothetical protein I7I50_02682 [Histoplasma capsulatum G186AR]